MKKSKKIKESFNSLSSIKTLNKINRKNRISEQQMVSCTQDDFNDMSASNDLPGLFVNGNPTNFINNMFNRYELNGCPQDGGFFLKILEKHSIQLQSGMGGPNSNKPMGPRWKAQKQSKISFLQNVIDDCCPADPSSDQTDPTMVPESNSLHEAEKASNTKGGTKKCKKDSDCGDPGKWSCEGGQCIIACKKGESDTECKARQKKSLKEGNIYLNHSLLERMQKLANIIK